MTTRGTFGRDPSDMFNYSDSFRKDSSTINILSFVFYLNNSFVFRLQQQFLGGICNYFRSLNYRAVARSRPYWQKVPVGTFE